MASGRSELSFVSLAIIMLMVPICIGTPPSLPFDKLSAQITVVSIEGTNAILRIDRIDSYQKGPRQVAPSVEVGHEIEVGIYYVAIENWRTSLSDIITGQKYSADIQYCISDETLTCGYEGWSAAIYSAKQATSPPVEEQPVVLAVFLLLVLAACFCILFKRRQEKQKIIQGDKRKSGSRKK